MDVPLHEVASYPRFHEASGSAFRLLEASLGSRAHVVVHPAGERLMVLKASSAAALVEGDDLPTDSDLYRTISAFEADDATGTSTVPHIALTHIRLPDGRIFGYLASLAGRQGRFSGSPLVVLEAAAKLIGFAIDSELRTVNDRLTGLYRRWMFDDRLALEVARSRRNGKLLAVVVAGFSSFEGPGGRSAFWWLPRIADRLQSTVRSGDTLGRLGEQEFGLVVPDLRDIDSARRVARGLHESLEDPYASGSGITPPQFGIGVACFPGDGQQPAHLIAHAERAMRRALSDGRPGYCMFRDMGNEPCLPG